MKNKLNNLISLFRRHYIFSLSLLLMVVVFGMPAQAGVTSGILEVLANIFGLLAMAVGWLLSFLLTTLVNVAQFNSFIYVEPVVYGWVVVRDVCNMFFIVVLLIIAFATILQINGYDYKKDVPKLVIAAILINFSKMFAGLMIDVSQVIMLTFVNAFAANGANNFAMAFQINNYTNFNDRNITANFTQGGSNFSFSLLLASIAGFAAICISTVIVVVMIIALIMRIVMLWIYVILSPLPYLLGTFQKGKTYADKWWGEFTKELIGGPVLAFFLWLALTVAKIGPTDPMFKGAQDAGLAANNDAFVPLSGGTNLFTNGPFQKYLIVIGLMVGGLKIAGEAGGTMGTWAKKGSAWVNSGANLAKKGAMVGFGAKGLASFGADVLHSKTGIDLNAKRVWTNIKAQREENKSKRYASGVVEAGNAMDQGGRIRGLLAMTGAPKHAWNHILATTNNKGRRERWKGGAQMKIDRDREEATQKEFREKHKEEMAPLLGWRSKVASETEKKHYQEDIKLNEEEVQSLKNKKEENSRLLLDNSVDSEEKGAMKKENKEIDAEIKRLEAVNADTGELLKRHTVSDYAAKKLDDEIKAKKEAFKAQDNIHQEEIDRNIPITNIQARDAKQKTVSMEQDKMKDMTDASELLRVLKEAISDGNKPLIEAAFKKMAKNGDDNEALGALTGRTDAVGLKALMRAFSGTMTAADKASHPEMAQYAKAGFSQQEAMTLGSDISMINKGTNHWAASGAYEMENGQWKETSDEDQAKYRHNEIGKMHVQKIVRDINRLGYGRHEGGDYKMDLGGVMTLKLLDNEGGIKEITNNMVESTAKNLMTNETLLRKLVKDGEITQKLFTALKERAARAVQAKDYDKVAGDLNSKYFSE